jgi:heterodisulfide reductase subunit B2
VKYSYYPGCSLERNAYAYHQSTMAVTKPLGVDLVEIDDWNCCGATEYISIDSLAAFSLIARNLAIAAKENKNGQKLVAPCSACYLNLTKTERVMLDHPDISEKINLALAEGDLSYKAGNLGIHHLLEIIVKDIGYDAVAEKVTYPLKGLKIAPYYGCMIVRPAYLGGFDNPEYPTSLDKLMEVLGAEVVDYPVKAHCCGGHMTQISEPVAFEIIRRLLKNAADYDADMIVTLCPMCQLNLDAYQDGVNKHFKTNFNIPILYFTQLMGLAFGIPPSELGIGKEFVDAKPALSKIGVEIDTSKEETKMKPPKEALPMPHMPEER